MPFAGLNHHVKPRSGPGSVQHSFCTAKAIPRAVRFPCPARTRLGRGIALPCVCGSKQESRDTEGPSSKNPASTFISYAKLLTLTGFIAASMLLEKRPAHARTSLPETVHTMSQASSSGNKRGLWSKLKATATAPVGMLDHLLFPDEPLAFIRSSADEDHQSTPPRQQDPSTAQDGVAPAATTKLPSALSDTGTSAPAAASTPDATPPAADDDDNGDAANFTFAADQARLPAPPSTGQLSAAVSAASDRLAARLAQLSAAMSPGWPAESAALGAVSRLPVEVAGGEDPVVSAALARQLVRGGYALAGLVVAVVAWQLAASLPGTVKGREAVRPLEDNAFEEPTTSELTPTTNTSSTPEVADPSSPAPSTAEASAPQTPPQAQQLPVIELGPDDALPPELQGKNVAGRFCLRRPPLGPASHAHFSAAAASPAAAAAAAATAEALRAEAAEMQRAAAAAAGTTASEGDQPLHHLTVQEAAGKSEEVMQAALAAAAAVSAPAAAAADDTPAALPAAASEPQQQQDAAFPAVSVEFTPLQPPATDDVDDDDQPLFRVELKVSEEGQAASNTAAAAAADSVEGRLAAEVVREALVAESCAAAAAAAAERAQIASHLIEDAIAAAHSSPRGSQASQSTAHPAADHHSSAGFSSSSSQEVGHVEPGTIDVSWDEVSCSLAAEVLAAEVATAAVVEAPDAATAPQEVPVTWQQPPAAAAAADPEVRQADTEAPATEATAEAAAEPAAAAAAAAATVKKQDIPITWQQPPAAMAVAVRPLDAATSTQDIPISWQQPAAAVADDSVQDLVEEAKAAEAAAEEAEAARAVAAAAVARVAAGKAARAAAAAAVARVAAAKASGGDEQQTAPATPDASTGASATTADQQQQEQDMQQLIEEAKAAEAAAEEAETARAVAESAVARVAALKAAQASTPSAPLPQDFLAVATYEAAAAQQLIEEAKVAEAAALKAEAARSAAAAAVARVAASKAALANAAAAAVAEAAAAAAELDTSSQQAEDSQANVDPDTDAARSAAAAAVSRVAAARAAQAELIAEAIAAEAAAIAAEAAADAAGSAAAAEASAGDAAERVKVQLSSTTYSSTADQGNTTHSPVSVSWVLAGDDSEALAQLTHLAASMGHPAIEPISNSSSSSPTDCEVTAADTGVGGEEEPSAAVEQLLQAEETEDAVLLLAHLSQINAALEAACSEQDATVAAVDDADADAFKDEFGVPDMDLVTQQSVLPKVPVAATPTAAEADAVGSEGLRPQPSLLEVLDAASRQQMQAASETALQQAQARVVQLYRARKAAQRTTALQQTAAASGGPRVDVPHTKRDAAAAASRLGRPNGLSPLQQQLASHLGVSDLALALALAELSPRGNRSKGGRAQAPADTTAAAAEAASAKKPQDSTAVQRSSKSTADVTVVRSCRDPYSSTALVLSKDSSIGQAGSNKPVDTAAATVAGDKPGPFDVPVQKTEAVEPAGTAASKLPAASPAERKAGSSSGQSAAGRKQIEVRWVDKIEDEAESFEVAVQHMVINTAVKSARARGQSSAANKADAARAAATGKVEAAAAAASRSGSSSDAATATNAATEGYVEVDVARLDSAADSFDVAVQRMVSGATPKANNTSKRPSKAAAPRPNSKAGSNSSSSSTSQALSSSSKGAVRIEIKHPDRAADSFDVAVQQMVQATASHSNKNDSKEDADSSSQSKKSSSGPGKGFGKAVYINPSRQAQARSRSQPVVGSNVVPMYNGAPINSSSLRPVPWWLQRAAARRTSSSGSDWDGFKPRPGGLAAAAAAAPTQLPTDATPAASAAAAPTSIPVEWLETPTAKKRIELQERAAAILKQQDGPGSSLTTAQTDKQAPSVPGGSSTTSTQPRQLPAGWGVVKVSGAPMQQQGGLKPLSWSTVSAQLMNELEAELSASLDPPAKPLADPTAELTAPYATPQVPSGTAAPGKSGRRSPGRKGRLPQGRQGPQGSKAGRDQAASNGNAGSA